MPRVNRNLDEHMDVRVVIVDAQGRYLAEGAAGLYFTERRTGALVLRYGADRVEQQLEVLRDSSGIELTAEPLRPDEVYETCDRCNELFMPHMTFFDGQVFLCGDCRKAVAAIAAKRQGSAAHVSTLNG